MKKFNFYSGPAVLPEPVLQQAAQAVRELDGLGLSLIEISHRSKEFTAIVEESVALVRALTGLGEPYRILWLQGGATMQFLQVPYNLLNRNATAAYLETGAWSRKAIKEARLFGQVHVVASSADRNFTYVPKNYTIPNDAAYFHITTNETIHGVQLHQIPDSPVPLIADMSSDIFSRPLQWNKFSLIYAGAQKNIGPSGATLVIVNEELLGRTDHPIPTMMDYRNHIKDNSLLNTPSTFAIYVCMLTLRWIQQQGGLAVMEERNRRKAQLLYAALDQSDLYRPVVDPADRSWMNVCWVLTRPELEEALVRFAAENGCVGIKGHRSVGGFRASLYNAMTEEGVRHLIDVLQHFERYHA
ncbi:MAG: 3-phosphoserine/phosphohydroxythreonine transaminase [Chitinophagales bacterium]|nr:3-phosphoserine/phosphohydroxythreonine transaminase [Chitinophagales bacterium]MDW8428423.1 3-phosphoserine/phosphohydroxythreonine transaminase [Chitinophagales bacterium]